MANDGFLITARVKRAGGLWRLALDGEEWFIRELAAELESTGGFNLSGARHDRLYLEQRHPLFSHSEE